MFVFVFRIKKNFCVEEKCVGKKVFKKIILPVKKEQAEKQKLALKTALAKKSFKFTE